MAEVLSGKVVVVTGGNGGIGAATLRAFRTLGAIGLSADSSGPGAEHLDVTSSDAVSRYAENVRKSYGRCDYLINSAGIVRVGSATELTEADWDQTFNVNVKGIWNTSRFFIPLMENGGSIVNISSGAGLRPSTGMAAYISAKAAVIGLTRSMALDYASKSIRVNCVAPGPVETPLAVQTHAQQGGRHETSPSSTERPISRWGTPDEVANMIVAVALNEYVTGSTIAVDGGRTMH